MAKKRGSVWGDEPIMSPPMANEESSDKKSRGKMIGFHADPAAHLQLRQIALEEGTSNEKLLREALNLLFASRDKPQIA